MERTSGPRDADGTQLVSDDGELGAERSVHSGVGGDAVASTTPESSPYQPSVAASERAPLSDASEADAAVPSADLVIPPVAPGEAIRVYDPIGSIRVLWPTDESVSRQFVSVLAGIDGSRYPLYLDRETAAAHCQGACSVVPADSIPMDPPPHAITAARERTVE